LQQVGLKGDTSKLTVLQGIGKWSKIILPPGGDRYGKGKYIKDGRSSAHGPARPS
jgi:hypothetical protein